MTRLQMVREIRRLILEGRSFGGVEPARLAPWWWALTRSRYDLVCTLDRLGYRCTPEMWGTGAPPDKRR